MRDAIVDFKESGLLKPDSADGFVFGILKPSRGPGLDVDLERNAELVRLARPFRCVFHRAFDDAVGPAVNQATDDRWERALERVRECGFDGILTSGGPGNAPDNASTLARIVARAKGQIEIIVGGGVRSTNVKQLADSIIDAGSSEHVCFHSSCLAGAGGKEAVDPDQVKAITCELQSLP